MDELKRLLSSKRKTADEEFGGRKFVKRGEVEDLRLKKLREEEATERAEKEVRRKQQESAAERPKRAQPHAAAQDTGTPANHTPEGLSREEVIRRLRVLKEPATLFGERDDDRYKRLVAAESNIQVEDEAAGGQQANLHIAIEREEKTRWRQQRLLVEERAKAAAQAANAEEAGSTQGSELATLDPEALKVGEAFKRAAEALAEQNMAVEDRISKWLRIWLQDWEADLEARSTEVKSSAAGRQADLRFKETEQYMRPLFSRLKNRSLVKEMLAGIKMIVDCMKDRNYLHAYKIYMGISIGNSPWPIGVTQVGLHERAAREKISFKSNMSVAHIMNDEATRKFIQALKRLMTFCQRRYPTDPSRSVDFDGYTNEGLGASGAGSDKIALLEAMAKGETVAPAPAPTVMDRAGGVKIPDRWDKIIKGALKEVENSDAKEEQEEQEQQQIM